MSKQQYVRLPSNGVFIIHRSGTDSQTVISRLVVTSTGAGVLQVTDGITTYDLDIIEGVSSPVRFAMTFTPGADVAISAGSPSVSVFVEYNQSFDPSTEPRSGIAIPILLIAPRILGEAREDTLLTSYPGSWSEFPTSYAYQWYADGSPVGANESSYTPSTAEIGMVITLDVTPSNAMGTGLTATTAPTNPVLLHVPVIDTPPSEVTVDVYVDGTEITVGVSTLSVSDGTWIYGPVSYAYQWYWEGSPTPIAGETSNTYVPVIADAGHNIVAGVVATNAGGDSEEYITAPVGPILLPIPENEVAPTGPTADVYVDGTEITVEVSTLLTADTGTWRTDPLVFAPDSYTYQWYWEDGPTPIVGATNSTYTPAVEDDGHNIVVGVSGVNTYGTSSEVLSAAVGPILLPIPENEVLPTVEVTNWIYEQILVDDSGTWRSDPAPFTPTDYAYKWQLSANGTTGWSDIPGETNSSYTWVEGDKSKYIRAGVAGFNSYGTSAYTYSTAQYLYAGVPTNSVAPVVTGTPALGQVLSCSTGTWFEADSFTYQWQRSYNSGDTWGDISGETGNTYTIELEATNVDVRCVVTAHNPYPPGDSDPAYSNELTVPGIEIPYGLFSVATSGAASILIGAADDITITGAGLACESSNAAGLTVSVGGLIDSEDGFRLVGTPGYSDVGGGMTGTVSSGQTALGNPLSAKPGLVQGDYLTQSSSHMSISGTTTLDPGVYIGGVTMSGSGNVTLNSGVYYIKDGPLTRSGTGNLTTSGGGVLIYMDPADGTDLLSFTTTGTVTLAPLSSTGRFANLVIFQKAASTNTITITGGGSYNITGTIYAAAGTVVITPNSGDTSHASMIVAANITYAGTGSATVAWTSGLTPFYDV